MYTAKIIITTDINDVITAQNLKAWEKSIIKEQPREIKIVSHVQLTALLKLHRNGILKYDSCCYYGEVAEVYNCGYISEPDLNGLGGTYEKALKDSLNERVHDSCGCGVHIEITDNHEDYVFEHNLSDWMEGVANKAASSVRPIEIKITEPEQLTMLNSLNSNGFIKSLSLKLNNEIVDLVKSPECCEVDYPEVILEFMNILVNEQLEAH